MQDTVISDIAISIKNVTKTFRVHTQRSMTLKEKILNYRREKPVRRTALSNICLDIPKGATVALLGVNGSGKSTLLKLMSRILYPDSGTVEVKGRVSSLLELGAGFHPDFTGRENIFMNGSLFGLSTKEIKNKLDDIIDFSELQEFIDQPVRSYSSGMYMRLAFSVATAVNPDVLLIDEILAVGDIPFQQKCMARLKQLQGEKKTIVIVTHDMGAVSQFCDYAVWIHNAEIQEQGVPSSCIESYLRQAFVESNNRIHKGKPDDYEKISSRLDCAQVSVESDAGEGVLSLGDPLNLVITLNAPNDVKNVDISCDIHSEDGLLCASFHSEGHISPLDLPKGSTTLRIEIPKFLLREGMYYVSISAKTIGGIPLGHFERVARVQVVSDVRHSSIVLLEHNWEIY